MNLSDCPKRYISYPSISSDGGIPVSDVLNVTDCQARCSASPTCKGIDYDVKSGTIVRCYMHMSANLVARPTAGVNQYLLAQDCGKHSLCLQFLM